MRRIRNFLAWLLLLVGVAQMAGQAQTLLDTSPEVQKEQGLTNEQARLSYALGVIFGAGMKHDKFDINLEIVSRGVADGMADGMAVTNLAAAQKQARSVLADYRREMEAKEEQERLELARKNRDLGKAFCEINAYREGVATLPSGLQFRVLKQGDGPLVDTNLVIRTVWRGTLIDGTEFQDTRKQMLGSVFQFQRQYVIPGIAEALPMMHVGDRWEIVMPADLAYGDAGYFHSIPPGGTLIYDLEVLSAEPPLADLITGSSGEIPAANSGAAPETTQLR